MPMKTFASDLLVYPKWHDTQFTQEQLTKHLAEVLYLFFNKDEHQYAEIIDLIVIAEIYLQQQLSSSEIETLISKRYDKFISKLQTDIS